MPNYDPMFFKKKYICFAALFVFAICFAQKSDEQILFDKKNLPAKGCYRIPAMATAKNGALIAVVDERINNCGDLKFNKNINLVMRRSEDGGKNWSEIKKIVDYPEGESASDASLVLNEKTGDLLLFYNYMDLEKEPGIFKIHVRKSIDNGLTWSDATDITAQISPKDSEKDFKFVTSGKQFSDANGNIYGTLVDLQKGVFVFKKDLNKNNFYLLSESLKPADESIVFKNDKNIIVDSRVNNFGKRKIYILDQSGKIQSTFDGVTDPGCNGSVLKTAYKGRSIYLFSNLNDAKERQNLGIRHSRDGLNWSQAFPVNIGDAAYSSLVKIDRKNVGIIFEKDSYEKISFKTVRLEDILKK